ncbi:PilN domain-containing protein [Natroniella sulfidigena]|uniref:PilN domain-containing protein n=1 Tax=Natroniella sulfidigena TaxID=723921 RepID=UPI00200ADBA8|nr:PilN domain-containing protein [Natroniella sulfidigena]MCK8816847.1 PilN domain-containing protein [Natroniella sulfidigena]
MINLLPPEYLEEQKVDWLKILISSLVVIIILVVLVTSVRLVLYNREQRMKLEITEDKLSQVQAELENLPALESDKEELTSRIENRAEIIGQQVDWLGMMEKVELLMPNEAWIEEFNIYSAQEFNLDGYVLRPQVRSLVEKLETSPYFSDLEVEYAEQREISYLGYAEEKAIFFQLSGTIARNQGEQ